MPNIRKILQIHSEVSSLKSEAARCKSEAIGQVCVGVGVGQYLKADSYGSPQDFLRSQWQQFRQWQSGILRHFSRQSLVIGHQSKREEVVKVRQDKRICHRQTSYTEAYRYDIRRYEKQKGDHLEEHFVTIFAWRR
jgi:hypothetical protein